MKVPRVLGTNCKALYDGTLNGVVERGTVEYFCKKYNIKATTLINSISNKATLRNGWKFKRVYYNFIGRKGDNVVVARSAEELADKLAYSSVYINQLANDGKTSDDGWSVEVVWEG